MPEVKNRTLRILFDMQACQTAGSAHRGVGRYSKSFFESLHRSRGDIDMMTFANDGLHYPFDTNGYGDGRIIRIDEFPDWQTGRIYQGGDSEFLDSVVYSAKIAPAKADIVHVSHVFEGFSERIGLPSHSMKAPGQIYSATLYDLIPLRFKDFYFQSLDFRKWYMSRMQWLRSADLLFAISESSRQDAINLLGIDGDKIVTVYGGIGEHFAPALNRDMVSKAIKKKFSIKNRFVLYTGGDDHRKNIKGGIEGFAAMKKEIRKDCQFVIVCSMGEERKKMYLDHAKSVGLGIGDVIITGFVSEADLLSFYQSADLFVFPSLYEGLGLPVLEAMACNTPVIGGNNSSVRELIGRDDALFNAASAESIANKMEEVLTNREFAADLMEFGLVQNKKFTWKNAASIAKNAMIEKAAQKRAAGTKAAINGWLPRRKMAMLTPLPPSRSGIADYNANFLPYLGQYFDIDLFVLGDKPSDEYLNSTFRIFDADNFEEVASSYDVILYEFGNSEFHEHMLALLEKFPGVVGLHDAYLSGLMMYLEYYKGESGRYEKEMQLSHGPLANQYFAPIKGCADPVGKSIVNLPCTKSVIDKAIGIISHSPFNLEVAREFYPESFQAPYRIIPQLVIPPEPVSEQTRMQIRSKLGISEDEFVIATFGHVAWTKMGDKLLEAFLKSKLKSNEKVRLIYVGELAADEWGAELANAIKDAKLKHRISITGFLPDYDYRDFLICTDLAIQLRTNSRGGTPKGVLDCLSYGVPVIVNNDASYRDYPDDVVIKIDDNPKWSDISKALEASMAATEGLEQFSKNSFEYIKSQHNPNLCAAAYASAINEFIKFQDLNSIETHSESFEPFISSDAIIDCKEKLLSDFSKRPVGLFLKRRVFIDISYIANLNSQTGISRVVSKTVEQFYINANKNFEPIAFTLDDKTPMVANEWLKSNGIISDNFSKFMSNQTFDFREGDIILMLDSSWARIKDFYPIFENARKAKAKIHTVVYDILPIRLQSGNIVDGGKDWFTGWLADAVSHSDALIAISKSEAINIKEYVENVIRPQRTMKYGYWHLGSDFSVSKDFGSVSNKISNIKSQLYLLMVGTVEPRKCHELALSSMEIMWKNGSELCLVIAGKKGWMVDELWDRIKNHKLFNKKLFLFEGPSDNEISFLYKNASSLLFLSRGEGFGLPLVEAANYGTNIICSDIPVFHEIAGKFAEYVSGEDAAKVATMLEKWHVKYRANKLPNTANMPRLSWAESANSLIELLLGNKWIKGEK